MKWLKLVLIGIVVVALVSFISIKWLEKNGFCTKEFAFLPYMYTNQELIDKAILYVIEHQPDMAYMSDGRKKEIIRYSNIEEFKKINPDCCKINYNPEGKLENSSMYGWIYLTYLQYYSDTHFPIKLMKNIEYNSCGEMKRFSF